MQVNSKRKQTLQLLMLNSIWNMSQKQKIDIHRYPFTRKVITGNRFSSLQMHGYRCICYAQNKNA